MDKGFETYSSSPILMYAIRNHKIPLLLPHQSIFATEGGKNQMFNIIYSLNRNIIQNKSAMLKTQFFQVLKIYGIIPSRM
jgi:hypothetical protein